MKTRMIFFLNEEFAEKFYRYLNANWYEFTKPILSVSKVEITCELSDTDLCVLVYDYTIMSGHSCGFKKG